MAILTPESLVLRGVAVLSDGTVNLRRGNGGEGYGPGTPQTHQSPHHPSAGCVGFADPSPRPSHEAQVLVASAAIGAGRSRSRMGVCRRPARSMRRAVPYGWPASLRERKSPVARSLRLKWARSLAAARA
jgi:hypothetical protein